MKLISKNIEAGNFSVINYNDDDKKFFYSLGFISGKIHDLDFLTFKGSGIFGLWNAIEIKEIHSKTKKYLKVRKLTIFPIQY